MKNKLIYKSKMDFVINTNNYAKEENNKIVNYVRKHLLNEVWEIFLKCKIRGEGNSSI